jgi:hypothetical protein
MKGANFLSFVVLWIFYVTFGLLHQNFSTLWNGSNKSLDHHLLIQAVSCSSTWKWQQDMFPKQFGVTNLRKQTRSKIILKHIEQIFNYTERVFILMFQHCNCRYISQIALTTVCADRLIFRSFPTVQNTLFNIWVSNSRLPASHHAPLFLNKFLETWHIFYLKYCLFILEYFFQFLQRILISLIFLFIF